MDCHGSRTPGGASRAVLYVASERHVGAVLLLSIDRAAPAPTSRRRLTHANNYLIVESRRPCESVSTKPTVQHIGHPRSATRAATPAPKDSQGGAVWWTMAQPRSPAHAATPTTRA